MQNNNLKNSDMSKFIITEEARNLYGRFISKFPFISISVETVQRFLSLYKRDNISMLHDYVLSQGLAEEVEE